MENELIGAIPLADMVEALRIELLDATRRAQGHALVLNVSKIEVELSLQLEKTTTGKGGVRFWVLDASAERASASATVHKLKLELSPSTRDGGQISISDKQEIRPE